MTLYSAPQNQKKIQKHKATGFKNCAKQGMTPTASNYLLRCLLIQLLHYRKQSCSGSTIVG